MGVRIRRGRKSTVWPWPTRPRARPSSATQVPLPSVGLGGVELRNSKRRASAPLELRPPLLQEGARALLVVRALEGLARELAQALPPLLRVAGEIELDRLLGAAHGLRRIRGDAFQVVRRHALQLRLRHQALDEADG